MICWLIISGLLTIMIKNKETSSVRDGLRVQFTRLWCAGGSITIFRKDPQLYCLDNKFSVEGIRIFLKFLAAIYQHKTIIRNNLDVLLEMMILNQRKMIYIMS